MKFEEQSDLIAVYDWCGFLGVDDRFLGCLRVYCDDGYWWYHPARKVTLTAVQMAAISKKLSELNGGGK